MNGLVNFVLRNKLAVWLMTIIVLASGIYSSTKMKLESIPNLTIPYLIVVGVYPGATPEQVMEEVAIPIEKASESLKDVLNVYSTSSSSLAQVQIEYEYGVDMNQKKRELEAALDKVTLPKEVEKPEILEISFSMMPVLALSVSSETEDIVALTRRVKEILLPKIRGIEGVASVSMTGQHVEHAELVFDEEFMAELGLTEDTVIQMLKASNLSVPIGLYKFKDGEQAVTLDGKVKSVDELMDLLIPVTPSENFPAPFVTLGDIAELEVVGSVQSVSRTNGADAIGIQIVKGQEANTVTVVNAVKDLIREEVENTKGLIIDVTLDQGEPVERSVAAMVEKALFGGGIAVLIILLFLRNIRSTIISIISIPVSVFMALLLLYWLDISLNIMTLGAITVAIGRVIDDSIVVVENIYRRLYSKDEKLRGRALIREATIEMFKPILSSTIVTVAVFAPLIFVGGMVGELFRPFALTMTFALGASLLVAITIVPALSHSLFRKEATGDRATIRHKDAGALARWYRGALEKALNHKIITSLIALVLLVGSLALTPLIGFSFLGTSEEKVMYLTYTPVAGELPETTLKNVEEVERKMLERDDVEIVQISVNTGTVDASDITALFAGGSGGALMYIIFDEDIRNFSEVKKEVEEYVFHIGHSGEWKSQDFGMGFSSNTLSYSLHSHELDDLLAAVAMVEEALAGVEGLEKIESDAQNPYVEHVLRVDQAHVLQYGLTAGQLLMALMPGGTDETVTTVAHGSGEIDVIVRKEARAPASTIDELLDTPVATPFGTEMALRDLVTVEESTTLPSMQRSKGEYYATVSAEIVGNDISKATAAAEEALENLELPDNVRISLGGVAADMFESFNQLYVAMAAAVAIVYFVLVVTFGEGLAPFSILFSLPFVVIGSFVLLYLTGLTISVQVLMGLLMLIGIVVTNAIVLVDRIVRMELGGMSMREAVLEAGMTRLRPILMTAIATIGAMIPMAVMNNGSGSLISQDLAVTVIGGLFSSTVLTLFIVPIVYEVLSKMFRKDRKNIDFS